MILWELVVMCTAGSKKKLGQSDHRKMNEVINRIYYYDLLIITEETCYLSVKFRTISLCVIIHETVTSRTNAKINLTFCA